MGFEGWTEGWRGGGEGVEGGVEGGVGPVYSKPFAIFILNGLSNEY